MRRWDRDRLRSTLVVVIGLLLLVNLVALGGFREDEATTALGTFGGDDGTATSIDPAGDGSVPGTAEPGTPGGPSVDGAVDPAAPGAAPGSGPATPSTPGAQSTAPTTRQGTPASLGPNSHGVTDTTITVGITWIDPASAGPVATALGADPQYEAPTGDPKAQAQAVVDHVNRNGGIAGRTVKPVYHRYDLANALTNERAAKAEEEMCARYTQDNKVFAMVPIVAYTGSLLDCANRTRTAFLAVSSGEQVVDAARYSQVQDVWYRPNWMLAERHGAVMAEELAQGAFFGPGARIGVLYPDVPAAHNGVSKGLEPALAAAGLKIDAKVAYPDLLDSPWTTYVESFKQKQITHVLFAIGGSSLPVGFFMRAASSQEYRPRYAIASDHQADIIAQNAPRDQLNGIVLVGWDPINDRGQARAERDGPSSTGDAECRQVMKAAGQPFNGGYYCDALFLLKKALEGSATVNLRTLRTGIEGMGDRFSSAQTWSTRFGPNRHDGLGGVRRYNFDGGCGCFVYASPVRGI